ncbi:hypothetical protein JX266_013919 [Neoarthrinium moseri]|nr:hypothetical protein JX266_013919 [Neoarthrinium moseri]
MASTITFGANSGFQAGIIHGPVNTVHHHAAPGRSSCFAFSKWTLTVADRERPKTLLDPSAIIPFRRDRDFVQRGRTLDHIREVLAHPGSRVALVGLGGVGKSQIAIEYAYEVRDRSADTWVFWVHASNVARYEQSFREIAQHLNIPEGSDPRSNIFELVCIWLRREQRRWIIILDNVDVADFLFDRHENPIDGKERANSSRLVDYLPNCENGSILITTRSKGAAERLVEPNDIIMVDPMDKQEALALVHQKLGNEVDDDAAARLVVALEYMPLAIAQAAAYIAHRAPRCSVDQYLEKFEKSDRKRATLLDYEGGQLRRDREAKNSIIITWHISFDHIRQTRPSAADLLALMSYFDRQGIPEYLLRIRDSDSHVELTGSNDSPSVLEDNDDGDWYSSESVSSDGDAFEEDVMLLRNFSFVSVTENSDVFEMHRLVQIATQKWLANEGQDKKWKYQFLSNLSAHLPNGQYENWTSWQALLPHAIAASRHKLKDEAASLDWATILYLTAWYYERTGSGHEAEEVSILAMRARIKWLGREHHDTLNSMAMAGLAYKLRGRWEEAEKLFVEVIEMSKQKLGADHPSTLTSMGNLASTYRNQGRWEEAEKLFVEVMETRKQKLGADHPDTLTSMNNLALTWHGQGRYADALDLMAEVLDDWMSLPTVANLGR